MINKLKMEIRQKISEFMDWVLEKEDRILGLLIVAAFPEIVLIPLAIAISLIVYYTLL